MKITRFLILAAFIAAHFGTFSQENCEYLVWADEFNQAGAPDSNKWGYDIGGNGWGNQELQNYTDSRTNSFVKDGKLTIKAVKRNNAWTSARLVTKGKGDWLYGRIEVKAKLPAGIGTWPAIWMLPTDWEYGGWPKSGEIDIMEHVGYEVGKIHGTIHTEAYNHSIGTQIGGTIEVTNVASEFHVYAIEWTQEEIVWYVDSKEYFRISNPNRTYKEWPFDKRFHLILNIAIGGTWGGAQGIDPNLEEATMEIDYVRVYKKKIPAPVINGKKNAGPGEELIFSTSEIQVVNYVWSFPEDVQVLNGGNTPRVTVRWGDVSGEVGLQLISDCESVSAVPFPVSTVYNPSGNYFEVPLIDEGSNVLWQAVPGSANQIQLSGTTSLIADYTINAPDANPYIVFEFPNPVNLTSFSKAELVLKTPAPVPGSFRIDLVDANGKVNLNDLFKINSFQSDGEFHTYTYEFGKNPDLIHNLSLIGSIRIYINYGVFGKKGTGQIVIRSLRFYNLATDVKSISENHKLKVWPNPFTDHFNVSSSGEVKTISGYNLQGQMLFMGKPENGNKVISIQTNTAWDVVLLKVTYSDNSVASFTVLKQK